MDEAEIAVGGFVISGSEPPGVLELVEAALDHVSQGVDGGIDRDLDEAVPLGRIIAKPPRLAMSSRMKSAS